MFLQRELFLAPNGCVQGFAPARVPHLTRGMWRVLAAILVKEQVATRADDTLPGIMGMQYHGGYLTRSLKRLIKEGCVEVHAGRPAKFTVTPLGQIAWKRRPYEPE